jgi:sec-independent protein translocase protein TatB
MNFMGIGGFELLVIGLIAFLILGAKGMRDGIKTAGKVMKEIREQGNELKQMVKQAVEEEEDEQREETAPKPEGAVSRPSGARPLEQTTPADTSGPQTAGQLPAALAKPVAAPSAEPASSSPRSRPHQAASTSEGSKT